MTEIETLKAEVEELRQSLEFANRLRMEAENAVRAYRSVLDAIAEEMKRYG